MDCDRARECLSLALDGALEPAEQAGLDGHLEGCPACADRRRRWERLRRAVRYEPVGEVPDVAGAVVGLAAQWQRRRRHREWLTVAALFLVAAVTGASFVGFDEPAPLRAAVSERVLQAQTGITSLQAGLTVVERGWHAQVPERRYSGRLRYRAPEALALTLADATAYPDGRWVPNDVEVVADGASWWARGVVPCPPEALPGCQGAEPRVRAVTGREPFQPATPAPLDLVVPVQSLALAAEPQALGQREVAGRAAFGIATTAGQVAPLIDGLRQAGTMREVHPADPVHLWLDESSLVPLAWSVRVAEGSERARWAARKGYPDQPGDVLLEVALEDVVVDGAAGASAFPPAPDGARVLDAGFVDRPVHAVDVPEPGWLPEGMALHRAGVIRATGGAPTVAIAAWSDGRAWVKVRATRDWEGGRLFGRPGDVVRQIARGEYGVAYLGEGGRTVALHGAGLDLVVTGSLPEDELLRVTANLGVRGLPVPAAWPEAGTVPVERLGEHVAGALVPPRLDGFAPAAARVSGGTAVVAVAGPGARGFVLTQQPGDAVAPPLDADVLGVEVRGVAGRYTPRTGELEWVEGGHVVSLRSASLPLEELLAVAEALEAAR